MPTGEEGAAGEGFEHRVAGALSGSEHADRGVPGGAELRLPSQWSDVSSPRATRLR
jgi:hypothetical protein